MELATKKLCVKVTGQAMPTGTHTAQTLVEAACPKPHADVVSWATQPFGLRQRD